MDIDGPFGELGRVVIVIALIVGILPLAWRINRET